MLRLQPSELALTPSDIRNHVPSSHRQRRQSPVMTIIRGPNRNCHAAITTTAFASSPPLSTITSSDGSYAEELADDEVKDDYFHSDPFPDPGPSLQNQTFQDDDLASLESRISNLLTRVESTRDELRSQDLLSSSSSASGMFSDPEVDISVSTQLHLSSARPSAPLRPTFRSRRFRPRSYSDPLGHLTPPLALPPAPRPRLRSLSTRPQSVTAVAQMSPSSSTRTSGHAEQTDFTLDGHADAPITAPAIYHAMTDQPSPLDALVQRVRALSVSSEPQDLSTLGSRSRAQSEGSQTQAGSQQTSEDTAPSSSQFRSERTTSPGRPATRASAPPAVIVTPSGLDGNGHARAVHSIAGGQALRTYHRTALNADPSPDVQPHSIPRRPVPRHHDSLESQESFSSPYRPVQSPVSHAGPDQSPQSSTDGLHPSDARRDSHPHIIPRRPVGESTADPHLQQSASAGNRGPEFVRQARADQRPSRDAAFDALHLAHARGDRQTHEENTNQEFAIRRGGRPRAETSYRAPVQITRSGAIRGPRPRLSSDQENVGSWDHEDGRFVERAGRRFSRLRSRSDESSDSTPPRNR